MDLFHNNNESNAVESNHTSRYYNDFMKHIRDEFVIQLVSHVSTFVYKCLDKYLTFSMSKNNMTMMAIDHLNVEINLISIWEYNAYVYENERMTMTRWYWDSILKFPDGRLPRKQNICRCAWKLFWTFASACNRYKSVLRNIHYNLILTR